MLHRGFQDAAGARTSPIAELFAGDSTKITLDVDLSSLKITVGFSSKHGTAPTSVADMLSPSSAALHAPAAITSVELGTTPGIASDPHGIYWLDDIQID